MLPPDEVRMIRMTKDELLASFDSEIACLLEARDLLTGTGSSPVKVAGSARKKHTIGAESRAKIAAARRKRWAAQKKVAGSKVSEGVFRVRGKIPKF
jgi:hypothetical protein